MKTLKWHNEFSNLKQFLVDLPILYFDILISHVDCTDETSALNKIYNKKVIECIS